MIFNERLPDVAEQYLRKGAKLYLEGQLATRKWTDNAGTERYTTEVVLQQFRGELQMLSGREGSGPPPAGGPDDYGQSSASQGSSQTSDTGQSPPPPDPDLDDEIPF